MQQPDRKLVSSQYNICQLVRQPAENCMLSKTLFGMAYLGLGDRIQQSCCNEETSNQEGMQNIVWPANARNMYAKSHRHCTSNHSHFAPSLVDAVPCWPKAVMCQGPPKQC